MTETCQNQQDSKPPFKLFLHMDSHTLQQVLDGKYSFTNTNYDVARLAEAGYVLQEQVIGRFGPVSKVILSKKGLEALESWYSDRIKLYNESITHFEAMKKRSSKELQKIAAAKQEKIDG